MIAAVEPEPIPVVIMGADATGSFPPGTRFTITTGNTTTAYVVVESITTVGPMHGPLVYMPPDDWQPARVYGWCRPPTPTLPADHRRKRRSPRPVPVRPAATWHRFIQRRRGG